MEKNTRDQKMVGGLSLLDISKSPWPSSLLSLFRSYFSTSHLSTLSSRVRGQLGATAATVGRAGRCATTAVGAAVE